MDERVLLVEDDPSIREVATLGLEGSGFRVTAVADGRDGLAEFRRTPYDLLVLDVMLPEVDGLEVCRSVRRESQVPIVMLSARSDTVDVVVGLELGADDYVTKPFELPELVARLRAVLRRASDAREPERIVAGPLEIDPGAHEARVDGEPIELTATEFRLLLELARRPKQVFTRELLLDRVWGYSYLGDSRLVDVAVQRLRAKIGADRLETVRGVGYRLRVD